MAKAQLELSLPPVVGKTPRRRGPSLKVLSRKVRYDPATGWFHNIKTGRIVAAVNTDGYVRVNVFGQFYLAHRLAWLFITGEWPTGVIDHINRNRWDNSFGNIRHVTTRENILNRGPSRTAKKDHQHRKDGYAVVRAAKINQKPHDKTRHSDAMFKVAIAVQSQLIGVIIEEKPLLSGAIEPVKRKRGRPKKIQPIP